MCNIAIIRFTSINNPLPTLNRMACAVVGLEEEREDLPHMAVVFSFHEKMEVVDPSVSDTHFTKKIKKRILMKIFLNSNHLEKKFIQN